jgi:hypothetical protein
MTPRKRHLYSLMILTLLFVLTCQKKEATPASCGCEKKGYRFLDSAEANYLGNGGFLLYDTRDTSFKAVAVACVVDPTWQKSDSLVRDYIVSGDLKYPCYGGNEYALPAVQITSITRK